MPSPSLSPRPRRANAAIVNGEMGCGKTTVGIATAAMLNAEGYCRRRCSPPHLVLGGGAIQGDGGRRQGLERQWPGYAGQAAAKLREQLGVPAGGARSSSSWAACGCGWLSLEARLHPPAHLHGDVAACPDCGPCHHRPRRREPKPGRAGSRGVPRPATSAPHRWTLIRPEKFVRQRPVLRRAQSLKRIPPSGKSPRRS